jgi:hypothetical protein
MMTNRSDELAFYKGRLHEFRLIKKERPAVPIYWDMNEERILTEKIDALTYAVVRYHCTYCDGNHHEEVCPNRCQRNERQLQLDAMIEELQEIGKALWSTNAIRGRQINSLAQRLAAFYANVT